MKKRTTKNTPVLGVTQAHLFFDCEPSIEESDISSETILLDFDANCFLLLEVLFILYILPVEALLWYESVEASEEHEALSEKLEYNDSCRLSIEGTSKGSNEGDGWWPFLSSISSSSFDFTIFLVGFEIDFLEPGDLCALFPASPRTGLASESATFIDLTLEAPDIEQNSPLLLSPNSILGLRILKIPYVYRLLQWPKISKLLIWRASQDLTKPHIASTQQKLHKSYLTMLMIPI